MFRAAQRGSRRAYPAAVVVAAFLGRYRGLTRQHTASDLRCFLAWCADNGLEPLTARRSELELFLRWMQDTRRFKPSTVSRRFSVVAGFYRTAVIDGVIDQSPAEHVRRPVVPAESPTLGLTHLQFEALLTTARESGNLKADMMTTGGAQPHHLTKISSGRNAETSMFGTSTSWLILRSTATLQMT